MLDPRIVESTEELERARRASYALTTYSNYIAAWVLLLNRQYGSGDEGRSEFQLAMAAKPNVARLQGGATVSAELTAAYCRGQLTLQAMWALPVEGHPQLARSAYFWLPVQSYYSVHGMGLAAMVALNASLPRSHTRFRAAFSSVVRTYFPASFCAQCVGGPDASDFAFLSIETTMDMVTRQTQLADPENVEDLTTFVGKSLSTTRREFLASRFEEKRLSENRKRLNREAKNQCCQNEHPTSICDLLYRLRLRTNYDSPDMYLFAPAEPESAVRRYQGLVRLTEIVVAGLQTIIEKRIGRRALMELQRGLG